MELGINLGVSQCSLEIEVRLYSSSAKTNCAATIDTGYHEMLCNTSGNCLALGCCLQRIIATLLNLQTYDYGAVNFFDAFC